MQRAVACRHWRETYTATTRPDGTVVEGYVDLIYRDDDGSLVVIDYKARRSSRRSTVRASGALPPAAAGQCGHALCHHRCGDIRPVLLLLHP